MRLVVRKYPIQFNGFYAWASEDKNKSDFFLDNISECVSDANMMLSEKIANIISSCDKEIVSLRLNKDLQKRIFVLELGVKE